MTDGPPRVAGVVVAGVVLRALIFYYEIDYVLQYRPELTTPLNSLERLQEGLFLAGAGLDPYAGDVFHQPPLVLLAAMGVQSMPLHLSSRLVTCLGAILLDVLIALGFASVCRAFIATQHAQQSENSKVWLNHPPLSPLLQPRYLPLTVAAVYLFNPWSLATSLVRSTSLVTYAAIVWSVAFAMQHRVPLAICLLAIATYIAVYPIVLLPALLLMAYPTKPVLSASWGLATSFFLLYLGLFVYLSKVVMGGWGFLDATYLWVVRYPDLTPNIGIFWYFFMELFDRFRNYFLFLLHVHPLLYVLPVYLRLQCRPLAATGVLLGIFAIFVAYPALGDFGLFGTSLLLHPRSLIGMRHTFVLATGLAVATVLLPVMHYLWLFPGSGNSNFFYNQTLVFQLFGVKVVAEFLTATLRRDKQLDEFWKTAKTMG
ncbi:hypothetical protein SDRG_05439 [Saprolegnia diclina VS20]|uniref:GPI transamidase subunit PIG-U n=1 Tax=Saprolegnia diclina (strain VS20) TaxID=1156394 RepID=T0RX85_SAPDV|nr:hypothetical protein SDRG_05439 [Saprolegnia diclina VS20]EQC37213.1 hypothetical protein SDRG_05439 [Saprolegnia diclina VS20]|eukprot:XP_008609375.1 hypothetical protein SDRG_05439 [Saprolegnia diclina VS20]